MGSERIVRNKDIGEVHIGDHTIKRCVERFEFKGEEDAEEFAVEFIRNALKKARKVKSIYTQGHWYSSEGTFGAISNTVYLMFGNNWILPVTLCKKKKYKYYITKTVFKCHKHIPL